MEILESHYPEAAVGISNFGQEYPASVGSGGRYYFSNITHPAGRKALATCRYAAFNKQGKRNL